MASSAPLLSFSAAVEVLDSETGQPTEVEEPVGAVPETEPCVGSDEAAQQTGADYDAPMTTQLDWTGGGTTQLDCPTACEDAHAPWPSRGEPLELEADGGFRMDATQLEAGAFAYGGGETQVDAGAFAYGGAERDRESPYDDDYEGFGATQMDAPLGSPRGRADGADDDSIIADEGEEDQLTQDEPELHCLEESART